MDEEIDRASGCTGKHPFPNAAKAWSVAERYRIHAYLCPVCHCWHIGTPKRQGIDPAFFRNRRRR